MAKTENVYTAEVVQEMVAAYTAVPTDSDHEAERDAVVMMLAQKYGKKPQSVRQKLVRENVYVAKVQKGKDGKPAETKKVVASEIAKFAGLNVVEEESLLNAGKPALQSIRSRFAEQGEKIEDLENFILEGMEETETE